jgi:hypothetical protein
MRCGFKRLYIAARFCAGYANGSLAYRYLPSITIFSLE